MSRLFKRVVEVTVDSLQVSGLRVQFKVEKTSKPQPNTLDLTITNLSAQSRSQMQKKGARVTLLAGYDGEPPARLFLGDARTIDHGRKDADWVTRIQCGDGEIAYRYGKINTSFGPGVKVSTVVKYLADALGIGAGNALAKIAEGGFRGSFDAYVNGFVASGSASKVLDHVMRTLGLEWSIQENNIQVLKKGEKTKSSYFLLTPETGMIGSPEHGTPDKKGIEASVLKVRSLLQPQIAPRRGIEVRAAGVHGFFIVEKVTHTGDTAGNEFYTDIEAKPFGVL